MITIQKLKKIRIALLINLMILLSVFYISNLDTNRMNENGANFRDFSSGNNLNKAGEFPDYFGAKEKCLLILFLDFRI